MADDPHLALHDLLAATRAGDARAREDLLRSLEPEARRIVGAALGAGARRWTESGDVVQQVLFEVLDQLDSLPDDVRRESLLALIKRRAEWRARDAVRNRRREQGESEIAGVEPRLEVPSLGAVTLGDERQWIAELIRRLPSEYAAIVQACAIDRLSYAEVARQTGLSERVVRTRYLWARDRIAQALKARDRDV